MITRLNYIIARFIFIKPVAHDVLVFLLDCLRFGKLHQTEDRISSNLLTQAIQEENKHRVSQT